MLNAQIAKLELDMAGRLQLCIEIVDELLKVSRKVHLGVLSRPDYQSNLRSLINRTRQSPAFVIPDCCKLKLTGGRPLLA